MSWSFARSLGKAVATWLKCGGEMVCVRLSEAEDLRLSGHQAHSIASGFQLSVVIRNWVIRIKVVWYYMGMGLTNAVHTKVFFDLTLAATPEASRAVVQLCEVFPDITAALQCLVCYLSSVSCTFIEYNLVKAEHYCVSCV